MSRLSDAQQRLERALARLEQVSANQGDDALTGELEDLRERYSALQDRTREVSNRLDAAISRMKTALDG